MKNIVILFVILCFIGSACRSKTKNEEVLGIDTMKVILWDMLRADEYFTRLSIKDSTAVKRKEQIRLYEQVYAIHHLRKGKFDSSYRYYEAHPLQFKVLLDSLDAYAGRERVKAFSYGQGH